MEHFEPETCNSGSRPSGWSGQFALIAGSFVGIYHTVSLNVSIPAFAGIFDADPASLQWLVTCFMLAAGMIAPISGYLGSRFGYRRIFAVCMAGLTLTSVCCGIAWNLGSLVVFRTIQGVFSGLVQPVTLALLYQNVPRAKQPQAVSVWSAASITDTAVAPSASGWFQGVYWPMMFWVTVIPSAAAMLIGLRYLPEAASPRRPGLDGWGMFLAAAASAAYLMVFGNLHAWELGSPAAIIGLLAGTLAFIVFVVHVHLIRSRTALPAGRMRGNRRNDCRRQIERQRPRILVDCGGYSASSHQHLGVCGFRARHGNGVCGILDVHAQCRHRLVADAAVERRHAGGCEGDVGTRFGAFALGEASIWRNRRRLLRFLFLSASGSKIPIAARSREHSGGQ
jgi:hypothetical protein